MIALNEADVVGRAIASCVGAVDEVVVVDGGSTDETAAIAQAAGARVIFAPWQDSFAIQRNISIEAAAGEWILVLDCDETLRAGSAAAVRAAARSNAAPAFLVTRHEAHGGASQTVRLARADTGCRFRRRVHETPIGNPFPRVAPSDIHVDHGGYARASRAARQAQNVRLLTMELAEQEDPYLRADLAHHLRVANDPAWREHAARAAAALDPFASRPPHAMAGVLLGLLIEESASPALPPDRAADLAERWYPRSVPLLAARLKRAVDLRRFGEALALSARALAAIAAGSLDAVPFDVARVEADVRLLAGYAALALGRVDEAAGHFALAAAHPDVASQAHFYLSKLPATTVN